MLLEGVYPGLRNAKLAEMNHASTPTLCEVAPVPGMCPKVNHEAASDWHPEKETSHTGARTDERQEKANVQFLEIAVRNIVGTPVRNRIELDTMREFHPGRSIEVAVDPRLACVLSPATKGLSPEPKSSEASALRAMV